MNILSRSLVEGYIVMANMAQLIDETCARARDFVGPYSVEISTTLMLRRVVGLQTVCSKRSRLDALLKHVPAQYGQRSLEIVGGGRQPNLQGSFQQAPPYHAPQTIAALPGPEDPLDPAADSLRHSSSS
jgi:predicted component of type VI protein secretion system